MNGWRNVLGSMAIAIAAAAAVSAAGDQKLAPVKLTTATPIADLYASPEKFLGKTIRIDGVVTAVCEEMGCWMALGETDKAQNTVRLKVDHDAGIVFPIAAKGKNASAEGVFEKIAEGDKEAKEAAAEQAAQITGSDFAKKYQLKATGAIVK